MKLMGLSNWMHWLTWYLDAILSATITIIIMVALVCIEFKPGTGRVLDFSDPIVVFAFIFLYALALIASLFAIAAFFNSREQNCDYIDIH